jgi:pimeloyl-ACP methyl ester carboxylesterase
MKRALVAAAFLVSTAGAAGAQTTIAGDWIGALNVPGGTLHLAIHIVKSDDGGFKGTMDSIDQGARGIPITSVALEAANLTLRVGAVGGTFEGVLNADGTAIDGTWSQGGGGVPLRFTRAAVTAPVEPTRPQNPRKPYPYLAEDVTFENQTAHITLAATLTIPTGTGPFPAVLLITGSGPQDRDESLAGHRPFLVLSDYLTRRGIAVLRVDDRGVGKSGGNFAAATTADFATDAEAGVAYLQTRREVNAKKIGLVGHSEGGIIAPMVAARNPAIAFIVLMAGPGVPGEDILLAQNKLLAQQAGVTPEQIEQNTTLLRAVFEILKQEKDDARLEARLRERLAGTMPPEMINVQIKTLTSAWYRYFVSYDPAPALRRLTCPVLAINGERDMQVPPRLNLPAIRSALQSSGNRNVEITELAGLNHLFQTAPTGSPNEYAQIEETISPIALDTIARWILKQ